MQAESTELIVVQINGENRLDSRLIAQNLGIEHEVFIRTLRKYQDRVEKLGIIRFENGVKSGPQRGKLPQYVMLNEDQSIFAATLSRNTEEVVDFKLALTIAFKEARERLSELEGKQPNQHVSLTPLADRLAATVEQIEDQIPDLFFAMATETHREVRHAEFLNQLDQDATAFPEISVGRLWAKHAREDLGIDTKKLPKYEHTGPGLKITVLPRCYPMKYLKEFRRWFREDYLPNHCPIYIANRKKRVERQSMVGNRSNKRVVGGN